MTTLNEIVKRIEQQAGHKLHGDEGFKFGDPRVPIQGITVCWTASPDAIAAAAGRGHNLMICHEELTWPYPDFDCTKQRHYLGWPTNAQRLTLLAKNNISVLRVHGTLDELYIWKAFREQIVVHTIIAQNPEDIYGKIFSIDPTPYHRLIQNIKTSCRLNGLRATSADPDRIIKTVAFLWGGMGLFVNIGFAQSLIELGNIDVMIAGETDNYALRFCKELGIDVIETSHEISENKGLELFAKDVSATWPALDVAFYENPCIWQMY